MMRLNKYEPGLEWDGMKTSEGLKRVLEAMPDQGAGYLCNLAKWVAAQYHGHQPWSQGWEEAAKLVQHALELDGVRMDGAGFNHPDDPPLDVGRLGEWNNLQRTKRTIWLLLMIPYLEAQGD